MCANDGDLWSLEALRLIRGRRPRADLGERPIFSDRCTYRWEEGWASLASKETRGRGAVGMEAEKKSFGSDGSAQLGPGLSEQ